MLDGRFSAEEGCEAADLGSKSCADVLRAVLREVANTWEDSGQNDFAVDELGEALQYEVMSTAAQFGLKVTHLVAGPHPHFSLRLRCPSAKRHMQ